MCSIAAAVVGSVVGGLWQHHQSQAAAAEAREQSNRQMELARQQAASPVQHSETNQDVTAAIQASRRRAAGAYGMGRTITGAGIDAPTTSGLGVGTKKMLGA